MGPGTNIYRADSLFGANGLGDVRDFSTDRLKEFVRSYPYREFRRHRSVNGRSDRACLVASVSAELGPGGRCFGVEQAGSILGLAVLQPLKWESDFFGFPSANLSVYVGPEQRRSIATALFERALGSRTRFRHIALHVDAEDFEVRAAAEDFEFRLMDTVCAYEYHPTFTEVPDHLDQKYDVRWYEPHDRDAIVHIASQCFRGYANRFYLDPLFGEDAALRFYTTWAENCCSKEMVTDLLVAEQKGKVVGFLGWRLNRSLLNSTGLKLRGSGLGGTVPVRFNAYRELIWHGIRSQRDVPVEVETHLTNYATAGTYQALGLRLVRARHRLHFGS